MNLKFLGQGSWHYLGQSMWCPLIRDKLLSPNAGTAKLELSEMCLWTSNPQSGHQKSGYCSTAAQNQGSTECLGWKGPYNHPTSTLSSQHCCFTLQPASQFCFASSTWYISGWEIKFRGKKGILTAFLSHLGVPAALLASVFQHIAGVTSHCPGLCWQLSWLFLSQTKYCDFS